MRTSHELIAEQLSPHRYPAPVTPVYEQVEAAANAIRRLGADIPQVAIVLGSGLGAFADSLADAVSTRYARTREEADRPAVVGYPPPAQVVGVLYNAIFLDQLDSDALHMQQINEIVGRLPESQRDGLRRIELLVLRPSMDLGRLANTYEAELPRAFRFLTRGLGTRETRSNDMLSLVMFQTDYVKRLIELGEADAKARLPEIRRFLGDWSAR